MRIGSSQCSRKWLATMKSCEASGDRGQQLAVVDHVDGGQVPLGELGVLGAQVLDRHPVDVADVRPGGGLRAAGGAPRSPARGRPGSARRTRGGRRGRPEPGRGAGPYSGPARSESCSFAGGYLFGGRGLSKGQTMASRPTIYIPNLDGRERLAPLLESLRAQTRPADVVVVDNGSSDGSQELLRSEFAEVELIELGENARLRPGPQPGGRGDRGGPGRTAQQRRRLRVALPRGAARARGGRRRDGRRRAAHRARPALHRLCRRDRGPNPDGVRLPERGAARGRRDGAAAARPDRRRGALLARPPSTRSAASTSGSSSTTRTSTWPCACAPAAPAASWRRPPPRSTPTRRRWARRAAPSTRAPAGRAATCCAATA